jgi:hypothetical protein
MDDSVPPLARPMAQPEQHLLAIRSHANGSRKLTTRIVQYPNKDHAVSILSALGFDQWDIRTSSHFQAPKGFGQKV